MCYTDLLRYAEATAVHKQQLEIARKIESLEEEADALYHLASFMMQIGQWHKFRMYKKTGVMIEDGLPGLNQALGTQTHGKDCLHEGLAGSCCVPVCVGAVVYVCTE